MRAIRMLLLAAGLWFGSYGALQLSQHSPRDVLWIAVWFACGIMAHDAIFAPVCVVIGLAGRRLLPRRWWAPTACGAVCTGTLLLLAYPVLGREHAHPDNPTVLDRNYPLGLAITLVLVWTLVAAALAGPTLRRPRSAPQPTDTPTHT